MKEKESIKPVETRNIYRLIADPLEEVVEGRNRFERYCAFVYGVLAKIWPPNSNSGEYGGDFWRSNCYDKRLLPNANTDEWVGGYTQFSPQGRDPLNLRAEEFETMVQNLGTPDYVRVRSIPPQLLQSGALIVPVGGSCAVETNGMRTVADIKAHIELLEAKLSAQLDGVNSEQIKTQITRAKELLAEFVRSLVEMAPTITHISGALLGGCDFGVHYWETDMWRERLVKDMGIPDSEAKQIVEDAYRRIHEAVVRRSQLINPNSTILAVNFDELELDPAIQRWATSMGFDLRRDYRIIEVIYTYVGPEQLDLLKTALQKRQKEGILTERESAAAEKIMASNLHVRGKQMDHLRWGSMNLPKEVIMGLRSPNDIEQKLFKTDYAYRMGTIIMRDVYQRHTGNPTSVAVGFTDLPSAGNGVQHESRDIGFIFKGQSPDDPEFLESVRQQLHNPARLNRLNIDEHLAYLENYIFDRSEQRQQLLAEMNRLRQIVGPVEQRLSEATKRFKKLEEQITRYKANIDTQIQIINFVELIINGGNWLDLPERQQLAKQIKERAEKSFQHLQQKQAEGSVISEEDQRDLKELRELINAMKQIEKGEEPLFSEAFHNQLKKFSNHALNLITDLESQLATKIPELKKAQSNVTSAQSELDNLTAERQQLSAVRQTLSYNRTVNYFPLSDNPFVHHAMQFLWDHDFAMFLKLAVAVQESMFQQRKKIGDQIKAVEAELNAVKEEEEASGDGKDRDKLQQRKAWLEDQEREIRNSHGEQLRRLMSIIYPKLKAYINYIYGRIDYPGDLRNTRLFKTLC